MAAWAGQTSRLRCHCTFYTHDSHTPGHASVLDFRSANRPVKCAARYEPGEWHKEECLEIIKVPLVTVFGLPFYFRFAYMFSEYFFVHY